ncbi:MAG: hypothetical protein U0903_22310 [Planctomycetales bacterium]
MFRILVSLSLVMTLVVSLPSKQAVAQSECGHCGKCATCIKWKPCTKCKKPKCKCCCPPAQPVQMTMKPVYETCYRKEQQVTCRQFVETHMRDETYLETIPVTKYDCVTVDEGCYQQIWVPKLVTKQVPRTEYVNRTACRQVPYQVTKNVPEMTTKMVPYQRVRYVQVPSTCVPGLIVGTSSYPPTMYAPSDPSCASPAGPTCASPSTISPPPMPPEDPSVAPPPPPATPMPGGASRPVTPTPMPTPAAPPPPAIPMDLPKEPMKSGLQLNAPTPVPGGKSANYRPYGSPAELGGGISPQYDPQSSGLRSYPSAAPVWQSTSNRTPQYR